MRSIPSEHPQNSRSRRVSETTGELSGWRDRQFIEPWATTPKLKSGRVLPWAFPRVATTRPSGNAVPAQPSIGRPVKIQGKSQRVLEPFHDFGGKPANSTFQTHGRQRPQSLNVDY